MRVVQLSVSRGGIPKRAVEGAQLTSAGIAGDSWSHPKIHGGPDQAVLLITEEGIDELIAKGFLLYPGALGENITTQGLEPRTLRAGQRFRVGEAVIKLTKRRAPCNALNIYGPQIQAAIFDAQCKAGDFSSPLWGLSGFYAKVIEPATIHIGDEIVLL